VNPKRFSGKAEKEPGKAGRRTWRRAWCLL
jgi:hypothetical protein